MGILQLLAKENYITYHKTLAKVIGVDEAILFGELCSMSNLYGYEFFCEQSKLINDTCLSEYRLRNALKTLQKEKLVSVIKKGLPAKNYYILNEEKLLEILECQSTSAIKFDTTGGDKFKGTGDSKIDSTFNKNTRNKNKEDKNTDIDIDVMDVFEAYNTTCIDLPKIQAFTDKRKRAIKARCKKYNLDNFITVFEKAQASDFLSGRSGKWSGANFDWLINENNMVKVLEGNYDNKEQYNPHSSAKDYSGGWE